jgi:transcriptional regulator of acetoin/glycerol metabolism
MLDTYRNLFDESESDVPIVRAEILESWRRSQLSGVDPSHVQLVEGEARLDSRIAKVAIPVLNSMADVMVGARTSLLLSAPDGTLLWRWDEDSQLRDRLNRSNVVRGTRWSEDVIGTNGLGTALETAKAVTVSGTEHFNEALHDFTCAGAPIRHPVTNRVTGVLSVTSLIQDASPLMAPTLLRLAQEIEEELYGDSTLHERQMLQHFLAERRRTRSAVVAVSADVFIANTIASSINLDHVDLWQQIEESPESLVGLVLPDGSRVTTCRPVRQGPTMIGAVVIAAHPEDGQGHSGPVASSLPLARPTWPAIVTRLREAMSGVDRLLVSGEAGSGKRTAIHEALVDDGRSFEEVDCLFVGETGREEWLETARAVLASPIDLTVFTHLDALDDATCRALVAMLDGAPRLETRTATVIGTIASNVGEHDTARMVLDRFSPLIFEVPPLRRRPEDAIARLTDQGMGFPSLSREVQQLVNKHPWPGNHRQLEEFRRWLHLHPRPQVGVGDLPRNWVSELNRSNLTAMQSAESELIASTLKALGGNKVAAASALGISRSSLYRKLREYRLT